MSFHLFFSVSSRWVRHRTRSCWHNEQAVAVATPWRINDLTSWFFGWIKRRMSWFNSSRSNNPQLISIGNRGSQLLIWRLVSQSSRLNSHRVATLGWLNSQWRTSNSSANFSWCKRLTNKPSLESMKRLKRLSPKHYSHRLKKSKSWDPTEINTRPCTLNSERCRQTLRPCVYSSTMPMTDSISSTINIVRSSPSSWA